MTDKHSLVFQSEPEIEGCFYFTASCDGCGACVTILVYSSEIRTDTDTMGLKVKEAKEFWKKSFPESCSETRDLFNMEEIIYG
jgi:hypothetical protein